MRNKLLPLCLSFVVLTFFISCAKEPIPPGISEASKLGQVARSFFQRQEQLGPFLFAWSGEKAEELQLTISKEGLRPWQSLKGKSFITAAKGSYEGEEFAGAFHIKENIQSQCHSQSLDHVESDKKSLKLYGSLSCEGAYVPYQMDFTLVSDAQIKINLVVRDPDIGRTALFFSSNADERVFGLGEQFSYFEFKGKRVPILVSEQGLARGKEPLTTILNLFGKGAGGYWYNSYAPVPHFISSDLRSLAVENSEFAIMDFRNNEQIHVQVYHSDLNARLIFTDQPLETISEFSRVSGKMRALPEWSTRGLILGLQGGTEKVKNIVNKLLEADGAIAAVWIQDWQGQRETPLGRRLWWNWELDKTRYHDWENFRESLGSNNIRLMSYINPFLVDAEQKGDFRRNLFAEALDKNYLMRDQEGELVFISQGSFKAYMIDVTHPEGREWMKGVIQTEMLEQGFSGWMADFGEALPLNAMPHSGVSAKTLHNEYPTEWAKINREAIEEYGAGEEALFFMRSAFTRSPGYSTLFWMGDQATNWDNFDGIKTSVTALLTSGLSGFAFNHGDVGGYFSANLPLGLSETRSKELMLRWTELGAFQPIFRTHEGLLPDDNAQVDTDDELLNHFARFSKIYRAWSFYREELIEAATSKAWPVLRHPFLHYPQEKTFWNLSYQQFMIGSELWFAPVLDPETDKVVIHLPEGSWKHAFTGEIYQSKNVAESFEVFAPIGTPAILYREGSRVGEQFRQNLIDENLI